jgi:porin
MECILRPVFRIQGKKIAFTGLSPFLFVYLVLLLILAAPSCVFGQTIANDENAAATDVEVSVDITSAEQQDSKCSPGDGFDPDDPATSETDSVSCADGDSLSNYETTDKGDHSAKTVDAELSSSDTIKAAIFPIDAFHSNFAGFYGLKDKINSRFGLAFSVDYTTLMQHSSFTESNENTASSSVFRILGTWLRLGDRDGTNGHLVWKMETRNPIFGNPTPRDMGFDTGSALSTANYKELSYWGITDLYWRQRFHGNRSAFIAGHMDPGDWADQYPLLNAWTSFLNDAFYNNPTEAIPKRGLGLVGQHFLSEKLYMAGGVHDANGKDGKLDPASFFDTREFFSWVEIGYRSNSTVSARQNNHLHFWHQDKREEAGTEESWGIAYTYSVITKRGGIAFLRAGYSKGGAAQMRRFVGGGMSYKPFGRDTLGIATSWGSPPDKSLRNQVTSEIFYRIQVTQSMTITPNYQLTFKPSLTLETKWLHVPGLRIRFVF